MGIAAIEGLFKCSVKEDDTERCSKAEVTVFGCALKTPPIWRKLAWLCAAILVCVAGLKVVPILEQRGYFTWAAELPVRGIALVFLVVLVSFFVVTVILAQRRTKPFRRPPYVPLLSGYIGPRPARNVHVPCDKVNTWTESQQRRWRLLQMHCVGPQIILCPLVGMWLTAFLAVFSFRRFAPGTNPDNWWTVGAMMCSIPISMYLYLVAYTRILIRRKGPERAMRFIFTSAVHGQVRLLDRMCIKFLGLSRALHCAKQAREQTLLD